MQLRLRKTNHRQYSPLLGNFEHHEKLKKDKGIVLLKIDLEKAYDGTSWNFIRDTMKKVNFPLTGSVM